MIILLILLKGYNESSKFVSALLSKTKFLSFEKFEFQKVIEKVILQIMEPNRTYGEKSKIQKRFCYPMIGQQL